MQPAFPKATQHMGYFIVEPALPVADSGSRASCTPPAERIVSRDPSQTQALRLASPVS